MYFVMDGTKRCGLYSCPSCGYRFLDTRIEPEIECPMCGEDAMDMEMGPDDVLEESETKAVLQEVIEGEEEVYRYDTLLSLAITGGNFDWL